MIQLTGHPRSWNQRSPKVVAKQNQKNRIRKNIWLILRVVIMFIFKIVRFKQNLKRYLPF
jgi:hypothetical protein